MEITNFLSFIDQEQFYIVRDILSTDGTERTISFRDQKPIIKGEGLRTLTLVLSKKKFVMRTFQMTKKGLIPLREIEYKGEYEMKDLEKNWKDLNDPNKDFTFKHHYPF